MNATASEERCPHANPVTLGARVQAAFGPPGKALMRDVRSVLIECRYTLGHRNEHRSADGFETWMRDLTADEAAFAQSLRARLTK